MTTEGVDNFIRANQTGLGTASDGQTWNEMRSTQNLSIASNQGNATNNGAFYCVVVLGTRTLKDADMRIRFAMGASGDSFGLTCRYIDTNNFYYFDIGNAGQKLEIGKDVSGTFTSLGTTAFTWSTGTAYIMHIRTIGTSLVANVWADGSAEPLGWMLSITDSSLTSGQFGVSCFPSTSTAIKFDSFVTFDYINTDDLLASDIGSLQQWGVDAPSVSDIGSLQQWGVDALVTNDASSFADSTLLLDGNTIADIGGLQIWTPDALSLSDGIIAIDNATQIEALSGGDSLSQNTLYSPVDILSVLDVLLVAISSIPIDALVADDIALYIDITYMIDGLTLSDVGGLSQGITNNDMSGTDSLIATDIGGLQNWITDTLQVSDMTAYADSINFVDIQSITDIGGLQIWPVDANMLSDALLATDTALLSDSNAIGDAPSFAATFSGATDALIIVEIGNVQQWGIDTSTLVDNLSSSGGYTAIDGLGIVDTVIFVDGSIAIDASALSDSGFLISSSVVLPVNITLYVRNGATTLYIRNGATTLYIRNGATTLYMRS